MGNVILGLGVGVGGRGRGVVRLEQASENKNFIEKSIKNCYFFVFPRIFR